MKGGSVTHMVQAMSIHGFITELVVLLENSKTLSSFSSIGYTWGYLILLKNEGNDREISLWVVCKLVILMAAPYVLFQRGPVQSPAPGTYLCSRRHELQHARNNTKITVGILGSVAG